MNGIIVHLTPIHILSRKIEPWYNPPCQFTLGLINDKFESKMEIKDYFVSLPQNYKADTEVALKYGLEPFGSPPIGSPVKSLKDSLSLIYAFFNKIEPILDNSVMIGFCCQKELEILKWWLANKFTKVIPKMIPEKVLDAFTISQNIIPYSKTQGWSQANVANGLDIPVESISELLKTPRSCSSEAKLTIEIIKKLSEKNGISSLEELYNFSENPPEITELPFGKYAGKPIQEICESDPAYLGWMIKTTQSENPNLCKVLKKYVNKLA